MLLHGEQWWLVGYMLILVAALAAAIASGLPIWAVILIGLAGLMVTFYGWLFQVGRFG
jgi:hypothetical protein